MAVGRSETFLGSRAGGDFEAILRGPLRLGLQVCGGVQGPGQWTIWGLPGQDFGPNCPTYPWRLYMVSGVLALVLALPSVGRWDLEEVT